MVVVAAEAAGRNMLELRVLYPFFCAETSLESLQIVFGSHRFRPLAQLTWAPSSELRFQEVHERLLMNLAFWWVQNHLKPDALTLKLSWPLVRCNSHVALIIRSAIPKVNLISLH